MNAFVRDNSRPSDKSLPRRHTFTSAIRALRRRLRYGRARKHSADTNILPNGLDTLAAYFDRREERYINIQSVVPAGKIDFAAMKARKLPPLDATLARTQTRNAETKYAYLRNQFPEQSELLAFHALLIALLRRREFPQRIARLFLRMWQEEGEFLATELPARWLISAATTFADIGETTEQRLGGQAFSLVFDLIKLHDSERGLSGRPNTMPFPEIAPDDRFPLAFDLDLYTLRDGDMDLTMLWRLHKLAEADPLFRPLGRRMLELLLYDNRTVFARVQKLKQANAGRRGAGT